MTDETVGFRRSRELSTDGGDQGGVTDDSQPRADDGRARVSAELSTRFADHYETVQADCFRANQTARLMGPLGTCTAAIRDHGFVYRTTLLGLVGVVAEEIDRIHAEMGGTAADTLERPAVRSGQTTARAARLDGLRALTSVLATVAETPTVPQVHAERGAHGSPGRASRTLRRARRRLTELADGERQLELRRLVDSLGDLCAQLDAVGPVDHTLVQAVHYGAAHSVRRAAGADADCVEVLGRVLSRLAPLRHPEFPSY